MGKQILLTGASGFVGQHVISELADFELHAVSTSKRPIDGITKQVTWDSLNQLDTEYDAVLHMAGLAHDTSNASDEQAYFHVNNGLTQQLLEHCSRWKIKSFIYLSSVKAAVDSMHERLINEELDLRPNEIYGRSKRAAEESILSNNTDFQKVILRPVMIYGAGQKGNLVALEKMIRKGIPFPIKNWKNRRSVLFVGNLTASIRSIIQQPITNGIYYVADDQSSSTADLVTYIAQGMGRKPRLVPFPNGIIKIAKNLLPGKYRKSADKVLGNLEVDNSRLKKELDVQIMPFTTEQGFKLVYNQL